MHLERPVYLLTVGRECKPVAVREAKLTSYGNKMSISM